MNFLPLLEAKRDGRDLSPAEIQEFITSYCAAQIPDYQVAALLMAIFFRGLSPGETRALTLAMRDSGKILRFPEDSRPLVDKHSTGGVGDKVSLPLTPLLACLGFRVPMISGRGLGFTGGTLDKLDSIPGFETALSADRIIGIVQSIGCVICGQTHDMVPADKGLYALRDVTGTVPAPPLIVASILSKKLAESLEALILDVKFGAAAFMPDLDQAEQLARAMVRLGTECGVNTRALLSRMDAPLGRAVGNWLEVKESVQVLENSGPGDLKHLVTECAAHLLVQTRKSESLAEARHKAEACLKSGVPRARWDEMLAAQGADLAAFHRKLDRDHTSPVVEVVTAPQSGVVAKCDARVLGALVRDLGGGRLTKDSTINPDVGLDSIAHVGQIVKPGDPLARLHLAVGQDVEAAVARAAKAFEISDASPPMPPLIASIVI